MNNFVEEYLFYPKNIFQRVLSFFLLPFTFIYCLIVYLKFPKKQIWKAIAVQKEIDIEKISHYKHADMIILDAFCGEERGGSGKNIPKNFFPVIKKISHQEKFCMAGGINSENFSSILYAIYWGIVTISTVGFGDITPITEKGKLISSIMIGGGIILVSALTGTFSAALVGRLMSLKGGDIKLNNLENHIVICGWNETAEEIVEQMISMNLDKEKGIVIITNVPKSQIGIKLPDYVGYKKGDFIQDNILMDVSIDKASDVIIVAEREEGLTERNIDARTALAAMVISNINPDANIYVEVLLDEDAEIFKKRMKVREVLIHGQLIGKILFSSILNPGATNLVKTLIDRETGIKKFKVSKIGKFETFGELLIAVRL